MIRKTILAAFILCHTLGCSQLSRHQMCPADSFSANGSVPSDPNGDRLFKREWRIQEGYTAESGWSCYTANEIDQLGPVVEELKKNPIGIHTIQTFKKHDIDFCIANKDVYAQSKGAGFASYYDHVNTVFLRDDHIDTQYIVHEAGAHGDQGNTTRMSGVYYVDKDNAASFIYLNYAKEAGAYGLQKVFNCQTTGKCAGIEGEKDGLPSAQVMDEYMSMILNHPVIQARSVEKRFRAAERMFERMVKAGVESPRMFDVQPITDDELGVLLRGSLHKSGDKYPKTKAVLESLKPSIRDKLKGIYNAVLEVNKGTTPNA